MGGHCARCLGGVSGTVACENGRCGGGQMVQAFTKTLGLARIHKKCGLVMGRNSLDAELGGCGMLMESSSQWIDKCWHELRSHFGSRAISVQVNIVEVSAHVFHSSLLVSCPFSTHFCF